MTQSIRNFWPSGWSVGTKLPGCSQRKNKKISPLTINPLLYDVQTAYSCTRERERDRQTDRETDRERDFVRVYEQTQRDISLNLTELSELQLLTDNCFLADWQPFQNLLIFIYLNSGYWSSCVEDNSLVVVHFLELRFPLKDLSKLKNLQPNQTRL